jgi:BON domain
MASDRLSRDRNDARRRDRFARHRSGATFPVRREGPTMTIDRVRSAVWTEPVRRLMGSAPSADELRSAIAEGLDALGESLGTVAERVDRSTEAVRDRVAWPEQLAALPDQLAALPEQLAALPEQLGLRQPPARKGVPMPVIALVGAGVGLAIGFVIARMDRRAWTTLRDRSVKVISVTAERVGAIGRHAANAVRGVVGRGSVSPEAPVTDDVLEARARSAIGRVKGLYAIKIEADDGIVRVQGRAEPGEREEALSVLRSVPGVREVEDRLSVETGATSPAEDAGMASSSDGWDGDAASSPSGSDEVTMGTSRP